MREEARRVGRENRGVCACACVYVCVFVWVRACVRVRVHRGGNEVGSRKDPI